MDNSTITSVRERYKPERVRVLLVGEAMGEEGFNELKRKIGGKIKICI